MSLSPVKYVNICFSALLASCLLLGGYALAKDTVKLNIETPRGASPVKFKDEQGNIRNLYPEGSKLTIVHFWATWCVPCVAEMPQVDATQWAYDKELKVVAISLDEDENMEKIKDFYAEHKIAHLKPYLDVRMSSFRSANARGLPTTLFIDHDGNEIARVEGPLDWTDGDVIKFIESHTK